MSKFIETDISDLYKEVYGSRPDAEFRANWESSTDAEKQAIWDRLISLLD